MVSSIAKFAALRGELRLTFVVYNVPKRLLVLQNQFHALMT